jgi:hypothetical protein
MHEDIEEIQEPREIQRPSILFYSSFIFITNALTAFFNQYYVYSLLFCILTTTSVIVHSNDNIYTNSIDKVAVSSIVFYGGYMLYYKINAYTPSPEIGGCRLSPLQNDKYIQYSIIVATFLFCLYLYVYGYFTRTYCFCDEKCRAHQFHCMLHVISSIGHHFIIFL